MLAPLPTPLLPASFYLNTSTMSGRMLTARAVTLMCSRQLANCFHFIKMDALEDPNKVRDILTLLEKFK